MELASLDYLIGEHKYKDSIEWYLSEKGLVIEGKVERSAGLPLSATRLWENYWQSLTKWSSHYSVPVELLMATALAESNGNPSCIRKEPGYSDDVSTPSRISPGMMQTLISTARSALAREIPESRIDRNWLLKADNSIRAGACYMYQQYGKTQYDPPLVACAYNAGGVYYQGSRANRWKMRQYPIGTSAHCDRWVKWFNDCFAVFDGPDYEAPESSFYAMLNGGGTSDTPAISS